MLTTDPDSPQQNRILAALSTAEYARLVDDLEAVSLKLGQVVDEPGDVVNYVYFPTTCIASLMSTTENGSSAELAMIASDGLIGTGLVLGGDTTPYRVVIQRAGQAYRMRSEVMRWELDQSSGLQRLALRYVRALMAQMAQNVVCNRHHTVVQQLCRWLLLNLDRIPGNQIEVTQEQISNRLGVRREGITEAAGKLQTAGLIRYSRGHITVIDRSGLEARVCECYATVKTETDRLACPLPEVRVSEWVRPNPATLRRRAEKRVQAASPIVADMHLDSALMLHELQVRQMQLEMQNEALCTAYAEADALRERYVDIYDFAPIGHVTLGPLGVILDINLAGAILLGITRSQRNRHRFAASVTPEYFPVFDRFLDATRNSKGKHFCEVALLPTECHGELIVRIEAVPDESGQECRMVLIDITAEKLAEKALVEREQYQRALLDNFPFMVWLKDERSRYLAGNAALAAEFGLPSPAALVGKTDFEVCARELANVYRAQDSAVLDSGQAKTIETYLESDGKGRWLEIYKSPITIDGRSAGTVGFARDITQRHRTQQALAESEEQYRRIVEKLPLGAAILQDGILRYINPKGLRLSGYSAEECVGKAFLPSILAADHAKVLAVQEQLIRGEAAPHDYELRMVKKNGEIVDCHGYFSMVKWDERVATLGVFEDVTEQKRLKDQLQSLVCMDLLTQLPNRRNFIARMESVYSQMLRDADFRVALLVIRIDPFPASGNTRSDPADGGTLQLFSTCLREQLRKADIAARIGDAEFAVLLPGTDPATAFVFAERLRTTTGKASGDASKLLSLSIGVSTIDVADAPDDQVLVRACAALRRGNTGGGKLIEIATGRGAKKPGVMAQPKSVPS